MLAKYEDLLCLPKFEGDNQQEVNDYAQREVHKALNKGIFLHREDENVFFILFVLLFPSYFSC